MAHLQTLPSDLLVEILSSAQSLQDLHSLILASRPFYLAFALYRKSILLSVLEADSGPINYRNLLAILPVCSGAVYDKVDRGLIRLHRKKYGDNADISWMERDPKFRFELFGPYIEAYFTTKALQPYVDLYFSTTPLEGPCDAASLANIMGVYKNVCRHTNRYFSWASRRFGEIEGAGIAIAPLSKTERTRIQRAFLHYEMYCRLFPYDKRQQKMGFFYKAMQEAQFDLFVGRLEPWEVEEMSSIYCYLASLARGFIVDFEDQFVEAFLSCPGVQLSPPTPTQSKKRVRVQSEHDFAHGHDAFYAAAKRRSREETKEQQKRTAGEVGKGVEQCETMVSFSQSLWGLDILVKRDRWDRVFNFANHLASLGLEAFSALMEASTPDQAKERRRLIRSVGGLTQGKFLGEILGSYEVSTLENEDDVGDEELEENEDAARPNVGYREYARYRYRHRQIRPRFLLSWHPYALLPPRISRYREISYDDPLFEGGCFFWDKERSVVFLDKLRRHTPVPPRTARSVPPVDRGAFFQDEGELSRWHDRDSVEKRLEGAMIPVSQVMTLVDEFSWLSDS